MVSLVILSENPPQSLLDDINNQTYRDFEVIIAKEKGIVRAMNNALDKAKGDIFVRIDDDVKLPEFWLEEIVKSFEWKADFSPGAVNYYYEVAGVTGPTLVPSELQDNRDSIKFAKKLMANRFFRWLMDGSPEAPAKIFNCGAVSYGSNFAHCIEDGKKYEIDHLEGTNWAMRTHLIKAVGGFDPKFDGVAEWYDDDVVFKIKKMLYRAAPKFKLNPKDPSLLKNRKVRDFFKYATDEVSSTLEIKCKLIYNQRAYVFHLINHGSHYDERFEWASRIKNWLRFHWRHSKFHYKKIIWLALMIGYYLTRRKK